MILSELTEEFIDKHYFVLDKPYSVEKYDDNGFPTDEWLEFEIGSEWEITDDSYIGGDIHLNGLTHNVWIEISRDTFTEYFSAHEWLPRSSE